MSGRLDAPGACNPSADNRPDPPFLLSVAGRVRIYRNGVLDLETTVQTVAPKRRANLWIGRSPYANDAYAAVDLANMHAWGRELTPEEVVYDMCHERRAGECLGLVLHLSVENFAVVDKSHNG